MTAPPGRQSRPAGSGPAGVDVADDEDSQPLARGSDTTADPRFQVMPPLTADELTALRDDIAARGVVVPVVVDQHGRTLDGHHRLAIAEELGIDCPSEVRHVRNDDDARAVALALNLARRHLTREQRRELIRAEVETRPGDSDRAIARRLGCDHKTVAAVRREGGEIPQLEPMSVMEAARAEELVTLINTCLENLDRDLSKLLAGGVAPLSVVGVLTSIDRRLEASGECDGEVLETIRRVMIQPRIDALLALGGAA